MMTLGCCFPRRAARAFTLLEMLIVVGVIATIMAIGAPKLAARQDYYELAAVQRDLISALRATRAQAIREHRDASLFLDVEERRYRLDNGDWQNFPRDIHVETIAAEVDINGAVVAFRFFYDGASNGGRIILSRDESELGVDIVWMTGKISGLTAEQLDESR